MDEWSCSEIDPHHFEVTAKDGGVQLTAQIELGPRFPTATDADRYKFAAVELWPVVIAMQQEPRRMGG